MSRYLQVPVTSVQDIGYKPPIEWWDAELQRKNKAAEEVSEGIDKVGATTFVNMSKDQEWADKIRADISSNEERLSKMYAEDPIKAANATKQYTRELKRNIETPGQPIYEIVGEVTRDKAQQEATEKIQKDNPELNWFVNYELPKQNAKALYQENGEIKGQTYYPGIRSVPNVPEKIDESLAEIKAKVEETNPGFSWIDEIGKWKAQSQTTKGVTESSIQKTVLGMMLTDENLKWGAQQYVLKQMAQDANKIGADGNYLYQGNTLQERLDNLELSYQESVKDIKANQIANLTTELNKTTNPVQQKEIIEQINSIAGKDAASKYQSDFLQNILETGIAKYTPQEKTIQWSLFDESDAQKKKAQSANLGITTAGQFGTEYKSMEDLTKQAEKSKASLDGYKSSIKNIGYQQAINFGLLDDKKVVPGTNIDISTPSQKAQDELLNLTTQIVPLLNSNEPNKQELIENKINDLRLQLGVQTQTPFKFNSEKEFIDFQNQQVKTFEHMKEILRIEEEQELVEDTKVNIASAVIDNNLLSKNGLDYNSQTIKTVTKGYGGKEGTKEYDIVKETKAPPEHKQILENFYNIKEDNYVEFVRTHAGKSLEELTQLNQELAQTTGASNLSENQSQTVKDAVTGLYYRLQEAQNLIDKEIKNNPNLLNNSTNVKIFTPTGENPFIDEFTESITKTFDKTKILRTLTTPNGKTFEQAVQEAQDDSNWTVEKIKPGSVYASIVANPKGEHPLLQIAFTGTDEKQMAPVLVKITENDQPGTYSQIMNFANQLAQKEYPAEMTAEQKKEQQTNDAFLGHLNFAPVIYSSFIAANVTAKDKETNPVPVGTINNHVIEVSRNQWGNYQLYLDGKEFYSANYEISDKPKSLENVYMQLGEIVRKYNAN